MLFICNILLKHRSADFTEGVANVISAQRRFTDPPGSPLIVSAAVGVCQIAS